MDEGQIATGRPRYLRRKQAAALLSVSPRTLEDLGRRREGPPYSKVGSIVLYDELELRRWVERGRVVTAPASQESEEPSR